MIINFSKMQGAGNDFILIDNRDASPDQLRYFQTAAEKSAFATKMCQRARAVGADGVIFIESAAPTDQVNAFQWDFYNSDGSGAEMCGNGARCAAVFAWLNKIVSCKEFAFLTRAGSIQAKITDLGAEVSIGTSQKPEKIADLVVADQMFSAYTVNTGVPHCVVPLTDIHNWSKEELRQYGAAIRYHDIFKPAGTNANFIMPHNPNAEYPANAIDIRTYERGVEDETLACGTGSIAAALVASQLWRWDATAPVSVYTKSGDVLRIKFTLLDNGSATNIILEGSAVLVYSGYLDF